MNEIHWQTRIIINNINYRIYPFRNTQMYVCLCRGITDQDIKDAVENGAESYREIRDLLDWGTCCGRCVPEARAIISDELAEIASRIAIAA